MAARGNDASDTARPSDRRFARGNGRSAHHELRSRQLSREAFERRLDQALDPSRRPIGRATRTWTTRRTANTRRRRKPSSAGASTGSAAARVDDNEHIINVFGGNTRKGAWDVPRAIRVINIFGGAELDFTDARFTTETTYITVFCLFGGVNIRVRDGMSTVSKALCIFGGVDNRSGNDVRSERAAARRQRLSLVRRRRHPREEDAEATPPRVRGSAAHDVRSGAAAR